MGRSNNQRSFGVGSVNAEQVAKLILQMQGTRNNLTADIDAEEKRAKMSDPTNFAYPPLAAANRARRDRLDQSIVALKQRLEDAIQTVERQQAA